MKLTGAVVLITGANGGIGTEFIKQLQAAGVAKIYAAARRIETLDAVKAMAPQTIVPVAVDVTNPGQVEAAAAQCSDVNLLINNAGVSFDTSVLSAPSLESARKEMEVNYFGTMSMCRAFADVLKNNGGGAIVNIASLVGKVNLPFMGTYCASKAAEISLTQCVRAELAAQGTLVVAVMPATVDTDFAKDYPPPKVAPSEVVSTTLQAIEQGEEDVYPGEQAVYLSQALLQDPKGVEKQLAGMLPSMLEQLKQQS